MKLYTKYEVLLRCTGMLLHLLNTLLRSYFEVMLHETTTPKYITAVMIFCRIISYVHRWVVHSQGSTNFITSKYELGVLSAAHVSRTSENGMFDGVLVALFGVVCMCTTAVVRVCCDTTNEYSSVRVFSSLSLDATLKYKRINRRQQCSSTSKQIIT